jgi:hypothetical protein
MQYYARAPEGWPGSRSDDIRKNIYGAGGVHWWHEIFKRILSVLIAVDPQLRHSERLTKGPATNDLSSSPPSSAITVSMCTLQNTFSSSSPIANTPCMKHYRNRTTSNIENLQCRECEMMGRFSRDYACCCATYPIMLRPLSFLRFPHF